MRRIYNRAVNRLSNPLGKTASLVPILLLVLGVVLSVALWRGFVQERREHFEATMAGGRGEARAVGRRIGGQVDALENLAASWARFGRQPAEEWRSSAELMVRNVPGLQSVAWMDPAYGDVWVAGAEEGLRRVATGQRREGLARAVAEAGDRPGPTVLGPVVEEDLAFYRVVVPVREGGGFVGHLVATARVDETLAPVLADPAHRFAVTVLWDGRPIYRVGEPASASLDWWQPEVHRVALPGGAAWEVVHQPTEALVHAILTPLPNVVLVFGLVSSLLLAALAREMRQVRRRAQSLEVSYEDLDARMSRKREEERVLRELNEELERRVGARTADLDEAVAELESFNYSVSHDLRSPVGAILNLAAILQEDYPEELGPDGAMLLTRIHSSAESAMAMMDGLLQLSRLGRAELDLAPVDVERQVREAFEEMRAASGLRDVVFEVRPLPVVVADRDMLRVVWGHLFRNALKFSGGHEKPRVEVFATDEPGETTFSVRDEGVGFDMRFADKLFRVFQRLHSSEDFEGTGVGLAVVGRIVRRHGGRVWAEAEAGHGATFHFSIPRRDGGTA